ncbi:integumentary mucin A.1-like [Colias croceus]|uniref:integumentary mucin A.1-like n=1 Tax=Colias crocea TaxID=72248 RepID=UPI001E27AD0D|nr:integumentary mucin A.1-like [Colias croceus]
MFPNFSDIGPQIEAGKDYTNVIVKVKNYKSEDLSVKIKGKYIYLQGNKKTVDDDRDIASEFLYTATLPTNVNTNDVSAKLYSDAYLVVTTPNEGKKEGVYEDRVVPIVVVDEPFVKPVESATVTPAAPEKVPEVTTVPPTQPDVPEATTQAETTEEQNNTTTTESEQPTTSIAEATTTVPEEEEKQTTKVEEVEATTPYIEVVTLNTTPYETNEVSDLEPISVTY